MVVTVDNDNCDNKPALDAHRPLVRLLISFIPLTVSYSGKQRTLSPIIRLSAPR